MSENDIECSCYKAYLCGFWQKEILPGIGEEIRNMILFYGIDKIAKRQARLCAGLFVERSDMMTQGADGNVQP